MTTSTTPLPVRPVPAGASRLAAATPAPRDRYVDFLRVFSLAVVMLGHWLMAAVEWRDGRLVAGNVLEAASAAQWLTWVFQIMPVFFVVGGFSNTAAWTAAARDGKGYGAWLGGRLARLVRPVLVFALAWSAVVVVLTVVGVDPASVRARSIAQPLWFLAVNVVVVVVAPAMVAAQRRWGWGVTVALAVGVAVVDLARWPLGLPLVGWANLGLVRLFAHQLGVAWRSGRGQRLVTPEARRARPARAGWPVPADPDSWVPALHGRWRGRGPIEHLPPVARTGSPRYLAVRRRPARPTRGRPPAGPAPGVGCRGGRHRHGHDRVPVAPDRVGGRRRGGAAHRPDAAA